MGKNWSRKRKAEEKKRKAGNNDDSAKGADDRDNEKKSYRTFVPTNAKMEAYYACQSLHNQKFNPVTQSFEPCLTPEEKEEERKKWITSMRAILPASFRIARDMNDDDDEHRLGIEKELEEFVGKEIEILVDREDGRGYNGPAKDTKEKAEGEEDKDVEKGDKDTSENNNKEDDVIKRKVAPAKPISFVPHGYQLSLDRRTIRRNPSLNAFHNWLKIHTDAGYITRQETVSMIPPIVLDPHPHHAVLDMCAAPGSKTCQLLEAVAGVDKGELEPSGFVVANDADPKRAYMLVHQLRRMNSPAVFVCACDAQFYPVLRDGKKMDDKTDLKELEGTFDRVLCDVPCSGDGTARKNPGIWRHWNQLGSLALHPLQIGIALNGARQTKIGGYMCYSTCSMNPVENEAVVAEILRSTEGSLELVDRRSELKELHARPGWTTWRVMKEDKKRIGKAEKNYKKKNSPRMQKRRKEWEEKNKKKKEEEDNAKKSSETLNKEETNGDTEKMNVDVTDGSNEKMAENNEKDEGKTDEEGNANNASKEDDSAQTDVPETTTWNPRVEYTPPPSWDEEMLLARAKAEGLVEYATYEDVPEEWRKRVRASVFPPTPEEIEKFDLHKCMRCLPHDMDTGGFFVALFKKVAPMTSKAKERARKLALELRTDVVDDGKSADCVEPKVKKAKVDSTADPTVDDTKSNGKDGATDSCTSAVETDEKESENQSSMEVDTANEESKENDEDEKIIMAPKGKRPNPHAKGKTRGDLGNSDFVPIDDERWEPIAKFYGLSSSFPRDQYMARSDGEAKVFYFISNAIKTKLIDCGIQKRVTVINSGLKSFERNSKECEVNYRIAQEGVQFIAPHMEKRKVIANFNDFSNCIETGAIKLENFCDDFKKQVLPLSFGSFLVALKGYENDVAKKMFLVMWKCRGENMNCLVSKIEMGGMKSKLRALASNFETTESEVDKNADKAEDGAKIDVSDEGAKLSET
mmetsp:Transcript_29745/g.44248  ORF Transcript_29745/g.44248 Transcript_29745/m.44248 type:complete len:976 (-) Transcript_29745:253-3180(-)